LAQGPNTCPRAARSQPCVSKMAGLKAIGSYENMLAVFKRFDVNRDGKLSHAELNALMTELNKGSWSQGKTESLLGKLDKDHDGAVNVEEMIEYVFPRSDAMGGTAGQSQYETVLAQFRRFDTNRNGTLSKPEFTQLMGQLRPGWQTKNTDEVFGALDKDRSGEVDSQELVAWLFGVPSDRQKAAKKMENAAKRGSKANAGPLVVIEFVYGERAGTMVDRIKSQLEGKMTGAVKIQKKVQGDSQTINRVSARDGQVVFWDAASMIAFRDSPFADQRAADEWTRDMLARHIPRLIAGTSA